MRFTFNNLKKLMVLFVTISFLQYGQAQHSKLNHGVVGLWSTKSKTSWQNLLSKSQWIWLPKSDISNLMLARKNFHLEEIPLKAMLAVTASSKYELFINEKSICQGPARSAPHHQSFDLLDITSVLTKGINNISIKVHHQNNKKSYYLNGRAGLLAQLCINDKPHLQTDNTWKVSVDPSWDTNAPTMGRFQMVVNDRVDLRKKIANWNSIDFNDRKWHNAKPLLRNSGWPAPKKNETAYALTTPWTSLVPRDLPYLIEKNVKATNLIEAVSFENTTTSPLPKDRYKLQKSVDKISKKQLKNYIKKNQALIITPTPSNKTSLLIFDFGKIINGMPKIKIQGSAGTEVQILASPFIVNNTFSQKMVDSEYLDKITLSGGVDEWQSLYFKPTRYLAITVKENEQPITIEYFGIHQIKYPYELKGTITVDKELWISNFWDASIKTIDVTTTDAMTDNYRERRQYAQTGYYAALGNYWTFGDTYLQRRYLLQVAQEQYANGIMPAYAPLAELDYMVILDSNCLWIRSLYNYFLYSGDYNTIKELLPAAKKLMVLLNSFTDTSGLLYNPPYAYWLDHTLNDRTGANLCLNGHYLGALQDFAKLLQFLNDASSTEYRKRAFDLKKSLKSFWDEEKGLFVDAITDGKLSKQYSEHGNAIALTYNIATKEQAKKIADVILEKDNNNSIKRANGMTMVSPAMSYFLHLGLAENGYAKESLLLYKDRFSKMLDTNTNGTLWEEWWRDGSGRTGSFIGGRTRSDAQTESAFPPDLFVKYILGIQVTKPGMQELQISKPKAIFSDTKAKLPSPKGVFDIEWKFNKKSTLNLEIPLGCQILVNLESLKSDKIYINNKKSDETAEIILKTGKHTINF